MPPEASPESHVAAGPWCFAGREKLFPEWEKNFLFAPEPENIKSSMAIAGQAARTLALRAVPEIAAFLDENWQSHDLVYWQILLSPWTLSFTRVLIHHAMRVEALVSEWGARPLDAQLLNYDDSFHFRDEADFILHGSLNPVWNHWLLSAFFAGRVPGNWRFSSITVSREYFGLPSGPTTGGIKAKMKDFARSLALKLPFPPLKGMGMTQALKYSLALAHACKSENRVLNLEQEFNRPESLANFCLPENWLKLMKQCVPESLIRLRHGAKVKKTKKSRLRVASINAYEDAAYRQQLALWREKGNYLAWPQHGCNYGQVRNACDAPLIEYSQQVFFTWGWNKYADYKGNFVPLPSPHLAKIAGKWRQGESLLFVGTEMATLPYRLDSRPTPGQFVEYRNYKANFMDALPEKIREKCLYRPYFKVPGCLEDAEWLSSRYPFLRECEGPLMPGILNCRLLALDHPGTVMLEAFAADVPMILYWNRKHFPLAKECDILLNALESCGLWHDTPEKAAMAIAEIWQDPKTWFNSPAVVRAREMWKKWQALTCGNKTDKLWIRFLKNL